ncbi:MAG: hypothetical protein Q8Q20_02455 [bacterium]|nr:hypothetical protein [bacterium]
MAAKIVRIQYNKLIRDKVPDNIKTKGFDAKTRRLTLKEFKKELLKKVGEEASALPGLTRKSEIIDELADTIDVIEEILRTFKISKREIAVAQKKAMKKKGGFKKRIYLYWSEDSGYRTNERRYVNK